MASEDSRHRDRCLRFIRQLRDEPKPRLLEVRDRPASLAERPRNARGRGAPRFSLGALRRTAPRRRRDPSRASSRSGRATRDDPRVDCLSMIEPRPGIPEEILEGGARARGLRHADVVLDLPAQPKRRVPHDYESRSSLRRRRSRRPTARCLAFPADRPHRSVCHCPPPNRAETVRR